MTRLISVLTMRTWRIGVVHGLIGAGLAAGTAAAQWGGPVTLRVATFNVQDVRTADLTTGNNARLKKLASVIQHLRPNVILLNEIAYDGADGPDVPAGEAPGSNA